MKTTLLLFIPELQMGGAARVVRDHAAAFATRHNVVEAVFDLSAGVDFPGEFVASLDVKRGAGPIAKVTNLVRRVARLRELKRRLGVRISVSHLEGAHYVDVLSRGEESVVLCVHGSILHNLEIQGLVGWLRKTVLIPHLYRRADRIVTVSRDIMPELIRLGVPSTKIRTINNFFDVAHIAALAREPLSPELDRLGQSVPLLATAGRLHAQKNQAPLLDILAQLRARRPVRLAIMGEGPLRDELVEHARALGLKTHCAWEAHATFADEAEVLFLGNIVNPFAVMGRAAAVVLSSAWEGFPLVLCEAMACGAPIVASDCPTGPREILSPSTLPPPAPIRDEERADHGLLMPTLDRPETLQSAIATWVEALDGLLGDEPRRQALAEAGRTRVQDFTPEKIVPQWFALFDELLAEPR